MQRSLVASLALLAALGACGQAESEPARADAAAAEAIAAGAEPPVRAACDPDNGGLVLPPGFCAAVIEEGVGKARHIAVAPNGDLYVAFQNQRRVETPGDRGGIVALRDTTGDGRPDVRARFGPSGGTGLLIRDGFLYFAPNDAVLRYRLDGRSLEPVGGPDTLVAGLPDEQSHTAKSLALGPDGGLFVNVGSPTNACQPVGKDRQQGVAGLDPCPQLDTRAGVWRFDAARTGQTQRDGERWATGVRNAVALTSNPANGQLYAVQHGRDQLALWPGFTDEENAEKPAEELQLLERGADFGWPYCYYDPALRRRVLAPEYGGDGREVGRCESFRQPLLAFPAHWAPNDLVFYTADQFPARYQGGAFIAFHGSWNRAPLPQQGYKVVFVPFANGRPADEFSTFADGFTRAEPEPQTAQYRPVGLAVGPDGSLLIADSSEGRIWRVSYVGGSAAR